MERNAALRRGETLSDAEARALYDANVCENLGNLGGALDQNKWVRSKRERNCARSAPAHEVLIPRRLTTNAGIASAASQKSPLDCA